MKKIFTIVFAIMLTIAVPLSISAEDLTDTAAETAVETTVQMEETVTEAAETATEAVTSATEEVTNEYDTAAETESDELTGLLNAATPEQIDLVKQYISYGLSALPLPDRVKLMALDHVDVIAWVLAAIGFVFFGIANLRLGKKHTDEANIMTDNAREIYEAGQEAMGTAQTNIESTAAAMTHAIEEMLKSARDIKAETLDMVKGFCDSVLLTATKTNEESAKAVKELSERETGNAEAMLLMVQVIDYLVQHSSIPEWEKDKLTGIVKSGTAKVEEVICREEPEDEN